MHAVSLDDVAERLARVHQRVRDAGGTKVEIVAVTKGWDDSAIAAAVACGLTAIGENYAQEAVPKIAKARDQGLRFEAHFIGQLQSNKVRLLAESVDVWQTLDRADLVAELSKRAPRARVMVQVNATGEPDKGGIDPSQIGRAHV